MLKPQDILCLLKLHCLDGADWTYSSVAKQLDMSPSEVHAALKRASESELFDPIQKCVRSQALLEFLVHGLKYSFPASPGAISFGLATAHAAEPLKSLIGSSEAYVWPDPEGRSRGQGISPLYRSVPQAAKRDSELYSLLSLIDGIRVGRVREQKLAAQELERRLIDR